MNSDFFVENHEYRVRYWYGGDINEDSGTVTFYVDGDDSHEGIVLTPVDAGPALFRARYWIPFDCIMEVSFK